MVSKPTSPLEETPHWCAYLCAWGGGAFGVCTETLDYAWFLRKPGALDEYIIALDENGHLIVEGEVHVNKTVATHLSTYAVSGSVVWQAKNGSGTPIAAVYQNNQTQKYDLVLAGPLDDGDPDFSYYAEAGNHVKVTKSGVPLMELKQEFHDGDTDISDGTLVIECTLKQNRPVGFLEERWDSPEAMATPLLAPNHFTFIPGSGNAMFVTERDTRRVRFIESDGTLKAGRVVDMSTILTIPPADGQHGLMGIACHPDFDDAVSPKRFVYVFGTSSTPTPFPNDPYRPDVETWVNKIYRFEVNAELTPIATPAPVSGGPDVYAGNTTPTPAGPVPTPIERLDHTGGCLKAYTDGTKDYLLLTTGCIDHERDSIKMSCRPQDVRVYPGKLLRFEIESDGDLAIPANNPFTAWLTATPVAAPAGTPTPPSPGERKPKAEVIASGLRNPYTFGIRYNGSGEPIEAWIADVGGVRERGFEEINRMNLQFSATPNPTEHRNFGFPRVEGNSAQPTPWPTPGYQMYIGCDSGCDNNGGDLSDCPSFPYREFDELEPPARYYLRPSLQNNPLGTVAGVAFASDESFPTEYAGDMFFLEFMHEKIGRIPEDTLDSGTPLTVSEAELNWWTTENKGREIATGTDGYLYYMWGFEPPQGGGSTQGGGINRLRFKSP